MDIEKILTSDFSALQARFADDGFTRGVIARLKGAEKLRLVVVGAAGAFGAGIAASQFPSLVTAIAGAAPALTNLTVGGDLAAYDTGTAAMFAAALVFAFVGGATALVLPGPR
ncbi:MAG: hypothetical protein R3C42_05125 [Parvularculaceae bacterium]|nr:hypothetical protein [Parvularculaceae bacterium]